MRSTLDINFASNFIEFGSQLFRLHPNTTTNIKFVRDEVFGGAIVNNISKVSVSDVPFVAQGHLVRLGQIKHSRNGMVLEVYTVFGMEYVCITLCRNRLIWTFDNVPAEIYFTFLS